MLAAQLCKYTKTHLSVSLKWVRFMACKLYSNLGCFLKASVLFCFARTLLEKQVFCGKRTKEKVNPLIGITKWPDLSPFMVTLQRQCGRWRGSSRQGARFLTLLPSSWAVGRRDWMDTSPVTNNCSYSIQPDHLHQDITEITFELSNCIKIHTENVLISAVLKQQIYLNSKM